MAARVFFSYAHDDDEHRNQLEKHLALLRHQGLIETWHDRRILPGAEIDADIDAEINRADIILLLVSASFIASTYCYSREMKRALERHEAGEAKVVPIIVRDCDWHSAPFGKLKAVPRDGKAIVSWSNFDAAYTDVAREIRRLVESMNTADAKVTAAIAVPTASGTSEAAQSVPGPRSGNMRVRRDFTDRDRAQFLQSAFEYIARYIDNSLAALSERHPEIQGEFRRIDANAFTVVMYKQGQQVSACSVRLVMEHKAGSIRYSTDVELRNSYNEELHAANDDQSLFLRSMGFNTGGSRNEALTAEGGAELFWSLLMHPLQ